MIFITKQSNTTKGKENKLVFNTGFVLPFSVLVSGILLSIGLGIFSITMKELAISSSGRESQFAFYAADTGGECALYWDIRHTGFTDSVFATSTDSSVPVNPVNCNRQDMTIDASGWDPTEGWEILNSSVDGATTQFDMLFSNGSCATVYVFKGSNTLEGIPGSTQIDSHGFNTCNVNNPRRVERGLRIKY